MSDKVMLEQDVELFEKDEWIDGFNWKTIAGCLFVGLIMMPGAIYLGLVTGQGLGGAAEWVTIILFIEIAKRSFVRLRRQEIIMIYGMAAGMLMMGIRLGCSTEIFGGPMGNVIWDQFFINSPQAREFADQLPAWFAPPPGHISYINRSFFDKAWLLPLAILGIHMVLSWTQDLAGAYVLYRVTNDIERLPFPMSRVHAGGATALAESSSKKETWRWRVFSIGAMIGLMFGLIYVTLPSITGALLPTAIMILPIPFVDFTAEINQYIPASALGLTTTIAPILAGFVLPFWAVIGGFVGAMCCWFLLNPFLYYQGMLPSWQKGMSVIPTSISLSVDYYTSQSIGIAIVICLIGIVAIWKQGMESEHKKQDPFDAEDMKGRGSFPLWAATLIWFACLGSYVLLCRWLVPEFPLWIVVIFAFFFTPLNSYLTARMIGMTGSGRGATFPFIQEGALLLSGYQGVAIWFAPLPLFNVGGGVEGFKQAELTRTRFISKVKGSVFGLVLLTCFSVFFWSIIWKLAPIPSGSYPFVQRMWPLYAQMQALWVKVLMERGGEIAQFEKGDMSEATGRINNFEGLGANFPKSVTCITEDGKGRIWVGIVSRGIRIFDMDQRRWVKVLPQVVIDRDLEDVDPGSQALTLPVKSVYTIQPDGEGRLFCGTEDGLLVMAEFGGETINWKRIRPNRAMGLPDTIKVRVDPVLVERQAGGGTAVWFGVPGGVCRILTAPLKFTDKEMDMAGVDIDYFTAIDLQAGPKVRQLVLDGGGRILAGTNRGLSVYDGKGWRKLGADLFQSINALTIDGSAVYAASAGGGVLVVNGDTVSVLAGTEGMTVNAITRHGDSLFVATAGHGLGMGRPAGPLAFTTTMTAAAGKATVSVPLMGLNGCDIYTVNGVDTVFISMYGGLLYYPLAASDTARLYTRKEGPLIETNTRYVYQDKRGDIWVMSNPVKSFLMRGIRLQYIMWAGLAALGFYIICLVAKVPLLFFYGAANSAAGAVGCWPHTQIPLFAGALLGRYYFARRFGEKKWRNYAPVLLAGFACGMGLIGMSSIGISLIIKAVNTIVY
ncbi:MAG: hypothetical protein ABIF71_10180 [Planctomycetota bacterium]